MTPSVVVVFVLFLALAAGLAAIALRREPSPPPDFPQPGAADDAEARHAVHQMLDERGTELLRRRVDLDLRRGTLGGNTEVYEAFEALEARLRAGDISEDEFEREKVRLLGG